MFPLIWMLYVAFSIKETIMNFKFNHADKIIIMNKEGGYGLQADALGQKGYTYQKIMCN